MIEKRYEINGVWYTQTPIVLGQMVQLSKIFATLEGDIEDLKGLIAVAGDKLPELMAVVLTPEGVKKKDKNISVLTEEMANHADLDIVESVVTDFFTCNPNIPQILEKIETATGIIGKIAGQLMLKFLSSSYASSLAEATLPSETTLNGESEPTK